MAKKHILFIDGPLGGGGAERVLIDILHNIDYSLYDVDLAVICRKGILMDEVPPQVNIIELWSGYTIGYKISLRLSKWLRCNWLLSRKMNSSILRRNYDIEISFLEGMPTKLGALRKTDARKVAWVHVDLDRFRYETSQFYPGEEIQAYNNMDVIVSVSKDCNDAFSRRFPNCYTEKRVIYNPVDRARIELLAQEYNVANTENKFTVISVGRITSQKCPSRMLEIARLSNEADLPIRFKWIGDGPLRQSMETMRDNMGLHDIVEFTGFIKNPFPHIKAADILMVTSDFEGFCLVLCEAMCLGVPVISTRTTGPSEIIGKNEYGILTDFSPSSMFKTLHTLFCNPELRQSIADKALQRPDDYSISRAISQLESLI